MQSDSRASVTKPKNIGKSDFLTRFLFQPFSGGIFGFAVFFSVLLITKGVSILLRISKKFVIDMNDVILASIGFVLLFLIKLLENVGRLRRPE